MKDSGAFGRLKPLFRGICFSTLRLLLHDFSTGDVDMQKDWYKCTFEANHVSQANRVLKSHQ